MRYRLDTWQHPLPFVVERLASTGLGSARCPASNDESSRKTTPTALRRSGGGQQFLQPVKIGGVDTERVNGVVRQDTPVGPAVDHQRGVAVAQLT